MQKLLGLIIVSLAFVGCSKDGSTTELKSAGDYYPIKLGSWHIYDVDSISYNDFTNPVTIDSISYQVKEELTDTFYDLEGGLSYEMTRSKRSADDTIDIETVSWKVSDIWWVKETSGNIERTEENVKYVSLMDPVKEGGTWNGNAYNFRDNWDFTYENVGEAFGEYSNTVTINQRQEDVVIIYQDYKEVYAKGIGLVSRTRIDVESQATNNPVPIVDKAEKGFQFFQTLNSYYIPE